MNPHQSVLIIDFGSQYTQLIARRVREAGVYCEIAPCPGDPLKMQALSAEAYILSGGPDSVLREGAPDIPDFVLKSGKPVLAICYGLQALCKKLGGKVEAGGREEYGPAALEIRRVPAFCEPFWEAGNSYPVWMSHGDHVSRLPDGFSCFGRSSQAPFAFIGDEARRIMALQFHPEVAHTPDGSAFIHGFLHQFAGLSGDWSMSEFREEALADIRRKVGSKRVICALSGGVDSSVAAVLIHEAIGEQLQCIFVDHGLLRKGEAEEVEQLFRQHYNLAFHRVEAEAQFLECLEGVTDPEQKRKAIGRTFIELFEKKAQDLGGADFLAQGTVYPDVIESRSPFGGPSATIKSHHNVGGLPETMKLELLEPLRSLFKDEVRQLGRTLGLPQRLIGRHPFPGPGLAIRIPGAVDKARLDCLRRADAIYLDQINRWGLYDEIWQAFALLLPVYSVGVQGDQRSYERVLALRAVTSSDGMTAGAYPFSADFLAETSARLVNEVPGINRVVYDVTSKPPGTIEWE